jgi:hypothetical protein
MFSASGVPAYTNPVHNLLPFQYQWHLPNLFVLLCSTACSESSDILHTFFLNLLTQYDYLNGKVNVNPI